MKAASLLFKFILVGLFIGTLSPALASNTATSLSKGIGATSCFDVISWQHHVTAKKDITDWVANFIKEVNLSLSKNHLGSKAPKVNLDHELLWFGTLAYCALDTKKKLVEAVMDLVLNEWEKNKEGN